MALTSLYHCPAALVSLIFASVSWASDSKSPALNPVLDLSQAVNISVPPSFHSAWPLPDSAPNTTFDELVQDSKSAAVGRQYKCDGSMYGHPPVNSCREALVAIPQDQRPLKMGVRGLRGNDVNLPYRFSSSLSTYSRFHSMSWVPC